MLNSGVAVWKSDLVIIDSRASLILHGMDGCREVTLSRGFENPGIYLLLVRWDTVEDHEI